MVKSTLILALLLLVQSGCREADGPLGGTAGQLSIDSDPPGGRIVIDDEDTGLITPSLVENVGGVHDVRVVLDSAGTQFSYAARVIVRGGELLSLDGPLTARCFGGGQGTSDCNRRNSSHVTHGNITFALNALGPLFLEDGSGQGVLWPAGTLHSYASNGMPLIAARAEGRNVALGMFDISYMAGRPAPTVTTSGGVLRTDQRAWIVPSTQSTSLVTIRGIEVRQQVLIDEAVPDVALIRITYRNITNSPMYQQLDIRGAALGTEGISYDEVFVGFALDADIGTASDDIMAYDPALDATFAYDADLREPTFTGNDVMAPALVGLRMLSAPAGARIVLNGYGNQGGSPVSLDWHAGQLDEGQGWTIMSGTGAYAPDDPDPRIGTLVSQSDVRMVVSAGPFALRPAEEITIVVAVALARPVPGTFTSPGVIPPGDPHDADRQILLVAGALREKLIQAATLLPAFTN